MFGDPAQIVAKLVIIAVILLVAFPVHEFAHAYAAYRLGDNTARLFGRLTLDPAVHFDPIGGSLLAISVLLGGGFGWAKPTPVNPMNLRNGRWGEAMVAAAGPASNLVLAVIGALLFRLALALGLLETPGALTEFLTFVLLYFVTINLLLMVFNLVPVPPLDGSKVLFAFLDTRTEMRVRPFLEQYGLFILLAIAFFPIAGGQSILSLILGRVLGPLVSLLLGFPAL